MEAKRCWFTAMLGGHGLFEVVRYLMLTSGLSRDAALTEIKLKREIFLSPGVEEILSMGIRDFVMGERT